MNISELLFGKSSPAAGPIIEGDRGTGGDFFKTLGDSAGNLLNGMFSKESGQAIGQAFASLIGGGRGTDTAYPQQPQATSPLSMPPNSNNWMYWLLLACGGGLLVYLIVRK